jgi:hypothetical protein
MSILQFVTIVSLGMATAFQTLPRTRALETLNRCKYPCSTTTIFYRAEVREDTTVRNGWFPWKIINDRNMQDDEQSAVDEYLMFLDRRYK